MWAGELVVLPGVEDELSEEPSGGRVDDADVKVLHQPQDVSAARPDAAAYALPMTTVTGRTDREEDGR
jgi:hypothetical protein